MEATMMPQGGCTFAIYLAGEFLGTIDHGELDDDGQWNGDLVDAESAIRELAGNKIPAAESLSIVERL